MAREKIPDEILAYHEAAHTVASHKLYRPDHPNPVFKPVFEVSIVPDEQGTAGVLAPRRGPWQVKAQLAGDPGVHDELRGLVEDEVVYSLAGYAAEYLSVKRTKEDAWEDVKRYSNLVFNGKHIDREGPFAGRDESPDVTEALEYLGIFEAYQPLRLYWLKLLFERTWKSVGEWWPDIERVAQALLERRSLDVDDLNELLNGGRP